jgi:hypothetical protein
MVQRLPIGPDDQWTLGLKHHEVAVDFTRRGLFRFVLKYPQSRRAGWTEHSSREVSSWRHNCSQDATGAS